MSQVEDVTPAHTEHIDTTSFSVFARLAGHEQVVFCHDSRTDLRAIIAIYSTALGPALGGTRFYPYATEQDALHDVLNLSRGMAYKAALAGLDLGGGKAVIIGDPHATSPRRCCVPTAASCSRWTAATTRPATSAPTARTWTSIARECDFVTGRTVEHGGAGDSCVLTAYGVFQGMRAAAEVDLGRAHPARPHRRRRRRRQGRPAPGRATCSRTAPRSSSPTSTQPAVERGRGRAPGGATVADTDDAGRCRRSTSTPRARSVARSTTRWSTRSRPGSSAARPTTSSPTRASRSCSPSAASSTPRTTASTPAA